jgi:VIT1/CCC1 family predicted Fe2+/Mn2+ transporter
MGGTAWSPFFSGYILGIHLLASTNQDDPFHGEPSSEKRKVPLAPGLAEAGTELRWPSAFPAGVVTMPQTSHIEKHFQGSETVRDIVIGMSDGLTVPFALAAGLSGAVQSTGIVITAGLAEIAAGSIAMGLGGYLAARTDAEHYASERSREEREIQAVPEMETEEVAEVFRDYGIPEKVVSQAVLAIRSDPRRWVDFMMRFELGLEEPQPGRARRSALTIALSYIAGGLVPLAPYFVAPTISAGVLWSVILTLTALLIFGYGKGRFTTEHPWQSAWQTTLVGGLAAGAAFAIAKAIS